MALRTHEIQNNVWDYHPLADAEGPYDDIKELPEVVALKDEVKNGDQDKYRGGFFFEGNSWGRYLHINNMKSCVIDKELEDYKR